MGRSEAEAVNGYVRSGIGLARGGLDALNDARTALAAWKEGRDE